MKTIFITLALVGVVLTEQLFAKDKPNILFFLVDDMGVGDTSVPFLYEGGKPKRIQTNDLYRTPHMEKLAKNGRLFTQAYSYSVCSPTRISLMTGQAAPRHGVTTWTHPKESKIDTGRVQTKTIKSPSDWTIKGLDLSLPLLPRILQDSGYATLFAGKAHFGPDDTPAGNPLNFGFDVNIAGYGGGGPGSYHGKYKYSASWRSKNNHQWDVPGLEAYHPKDTFLSEAITLEMKKAISKACKKKKPFYAYMSHYAVHAPYEVDGRFKDNYPQLKGHALAFATLVEGMDKSLGDLLAHLEKIGQAENTLIIFFSDNGSTFHTNSPYRDKKGSKYEGGLRVPLIVSWAKPDSSNRLQNKISVSSNTLCHEVVTCVDMVPTLLSIAGVQPVEDMILDGVDVSLLLSEGSSFKTLSRFTTHFPHKHRNTLFSTHREGDWKIIYNYGPATWELYNLKMDPFEKRNLISENPKVGKKIAQKLIEILDGQGADYPLGIENNEAAKPDLSKI
ncbi:MAG: sulfatase-like hydrolase/transferase [Opitutae bacterium]|jgi:arylsulfatase A-like enzyme|nr:sulfatase-like hydrolase/transferase [Opitutae bacterium]MBT5716468.1 sulfatase-like hydrolase/transferase [Opitutae bacterium]